jgi:ParB/RepB/Spo0J family partition protein
VKEGLMAITVQRTPAERREVEQLRTIPVSRIIVPDGFNPRGEVAEDAELEALAESMRLHSCLTPIRVRATGFGDYSLIAGERRYRAAIKAALTELPAIIRPAGMGDEAEETELLEEAVIENDLRAALSPLARARGYRQLRERLTVKGIAQRLCTTQARVKEHLAILALPEALQQMVDRAQIPLAAIKPLGRLCEIHPGLGELAVRAVLDPRPEYEPWTWAEVIRDPLACALGCGHELPEGVYATRERYPLERFALSEKARKDLATYAQLTGSALAEILFTRELVEHAEKLGAAHRAGWQAIIVGSDVAAELAAQYIAGELKQERAEQRRRREHPPACTRGRAKRPKPRKRAGGGERRRARAASGRQGQGRARAGGRAPARGDCVQRGARRADRALGRAREGRRARAAHPRLSGHRRNA